MNDLTYYQNLPAKPMAVGVLFFDEQNRLLIVKPTYKDHWSIPGGVVDKDESPRQACIREVEEELGLKIIKLQLLCLDYMSPAVSGYPTKGENMQLIFFGGQLEQSVIETITLAENELSEFRFVSLDEAMSLVSQRLARRLPHCLQSLHNNTVVYLEGGERV